MLAQAWRVIAILFNVAGEQLRAHQEYCFVQLLKRIGDETRSSYEQREIMLQALVNLTSSPFFFIDLYVHYDCELHGTNLCDDLVRFLATTAAGCPAEALVALSASATEPTLSNISQTPPDPLQRMCLEPLLLAFQHMADRGELAVSARPAAREDDISAERNGSR